jgi:hypothetical protein
MNTRRLISAALLAFAASCSDAASPLGKTTVPVTELEAARQLWKAQELHTYAFLLQRSCFCGNTHPLFVVVVNDKVAGVLDFQTTDSVDPSLGQTVDDLFAFIQTAIDGQARLIRATYDPTKGFPAEIDYDGAAQIADDEIFYRISDVHPIAPPRGTSIAELARRP